MVALFSCLAAALVVLGACDRRGILIGSPDVEADEDIGEDPIADADMRQDPITTEAGDGIEDSGGDVSAFDCRQLDAGPGTETWVLLLDHGERDDVRSIIATQDGGILVSGRGGLVVKLDVHGGILWQKELDVQGEILSMFESRDGLIAATGFIKDSADEKEDLWIAILDLDGGVVWQKSMGGSGREVGSSIIETEARELVIAGAYEYSSGGSANAWVVKLDADGIVQWQREFGNYSASSVLEGDNGELFVLAGALGSIEYPGTRLIKLDAQGLGLWQQTWYDDSGGSAVMSRPAEGGLMVFGSSFGSRQLDIAILRLDDSGGVSWQRLFGLEHDEWALAAVENRDGTLTAVGGSGGYRVSNYNMIFLRLDHEGHALSQHAIDISLQDSATAVAELADGSLVLGGRAYDSGREEYDGVLARLSSAGEADPGCAFIQPLSMSEEQGEAVTRSLDFETAETFESIRDAPSALLPSDAATCLLCP